MRKMILVALLSLGTLAFGDEVTWTCVNFSQTTFEGSSAGLAFASCVNVLVTDNSNGKSVMLFASDSGHTGAATSFVAGPPLEADYLGAGAGSVLVATGATTYLSGTMLDDGRLEANWPDKAGAFLSRFHVDSVDTAILTELGSPTHWAPEGSVSLTLADTSFDGTTLHGTLGGAEFTITTEAVTPVPEAATLFLYGTGLMAITLAGRKYWRQ